MPQIIHPAPTAGYRSGVFSRNHFLKRSRNFTFHDDGPRSRPGFKIRKQEVSGASTYVRRIPVDEADGTLRYIIMIGNAFFKSSDLTANIGTVTNNPYAADANQIPRVVSVLGKAYYVDGTDFRVLGVYSTVFKVKGFLAEPGASSLLIQAGGSLPTILRYFRIEFKDNDTGTHSGPDTKSGAAQNITPAGGNLAVKVTPPAFPTRVTHWRIGSTDSGDTPADYAIHENAKDGVGGSVISDANGWIPVASTVAFIDTVASSGIAFPFRTMGIASLWRHSEPPANASYIAFFQGRMFFASSQALWLVFSETDNLEHFYHDPSVPDEGFNTVRGDSLVDSISGPCTGLSATNTALLFFMRGGIVIGEGPFSLVGVTPNQVRDGRLFPLVEASEGCNGGEVCTVDQEVYYPGDSGWHVYSANGIFSLDPTGIRQDWLCRDRTYDHRSFCAFDPDTDQVICCYAEQGSAITGFPDTAFGWHREKRQWSTPWDFWASSLVLHRGDDGGVRGLKLFMGLPYGSQAEWGFGDADGTDPVGTDFDETNDSSRTTTTLTLTAAGWTVDEFVDMGLALRDRTTGRVYYKRIKSNTATVLTWDGAITNSGGGWIFAIAGFPQKWHGYELSPGLQTKLIRALYQGRDVMGSEV